MSDDGDGDGIHELVERFRRCARRGDPADAWEEGYNAALENAADDLERRLEVEES